MYNMYSICIIVIKYNSKIHNNGTFNLDQRYKMSKKNIENLLG